MSKFWQKKYTSKYTGAEIDAAVGKADTIPADYTFQQDGTIAPPYDALIKTELTEAQIGTLLTTGILTDVEVTIADGYEWPIFDPTARVPAYADVKLTGNNKLRAYLNGTNMTGAVMYNTIVYIGEKFYMIYVIDFLYNIGSQTLTCSITATEM